MRIETGTFDAGSDTLGWSLHRGSDTRIFQSRISFSQSFQAVPQVMVGLIRLDGSGSAVRVDARVVNQDHDGFTIGFTTWMDTALWGAGVSWLACGD